MLSGDIISAVDAGGNPPRPTRPEALEFFEGVGQENMDKQQLLRLVGSIILFLGVFAPIVSLPIAGNVN